MKGCKFLQTFHSPKPQHSPLSSSKWLMRILSTIVQPSTTLALFECSYSLDRGAIGRQSIGHERFDLAMPSQRFPEEFQCSLLIAALGDEAFKDLALVVNCAPEVVFDAIDLHEDLIEMPLSMPKGSHRLNATPSDLSGENRAETVPPEPYRLIGDIDPTLVQ